MPKRESRVERVAREMHAVCSDGVEPLATMTRDYQEDMRRLARFHLAELAKARRSRGRVVGYIGVFAPNMNGTRYINTGEVETLREAERRLRATLDGERLCAVVLLPRKKRGSR